MPQFNSNLFDSSLSPSQTEDSIGLGPHEATLSPLQHWRPQYKSWNNLDILIIDFQSIKNKKAELLNVINLHNPSILIGSETWLNSSFCSSDFSPDNYLVYRKGRDDCYGGIVITIRSDIPSTQVSASTSESVFALIQTPENIRYSSLFTLPTPKL